MSELEPISCIQYLTQFGQHLVKTPINSGSEVNLLQPNFARKLDLHVYKTDVGIQKINGSRLETFGMIIVFFLVENNNRRFCFFEENFMLVDISMDVAHRILFLTLSNVEINFTDRELKWMSYIITKVFLTT